MVQGRVEGARRDSANSSAETRLEVGKPEGAPPPSLLPLSSFPFSSSSPSLSSSLCGPKRSGWSIGSVSRPLHAGTGREGCRGVAWLGRKATVQPGSLQKPEHGQDICSSVPFSLPYCLDQSPGSIWRLLQGSHCPGVPTSGVASCLVTFEPIWSQEPECDTLV